MYALRSWRYGGPDDCSAAYHAYAWTLWQLQKLIMFIFIVAAAAFWCGWPSPFHWMGWGEKADKRALADAQKQLGHVEAQRAAILIQRRLRKKRSESKLSEVTTASDTCSDVMSHDGTEAAVHTRLGEAEVEVRSHDEAAHSEDFMVFRRYVGVC